MHKFKYYCATVTLLVCFGLYKPALAADNSDVARMSWLIGFWVSGPNEAGTVHQYVFEPLFNGELISTQMEVNKEGKTTHYELRTIHDQDGKVIFLGQSFKGDMSVAPYPKRAFESVDDTHINFTDLKLTRTGKNSMAMEFTTHPEGGPAKVTHIDMKRTMTFSAVK